MTSNTEKEITQLKIQNKKFKKELLDLKKELGIEDTKQPKPLPKFPHNNTPKRIDHRKNSFWPTKECRLLAIARTWFFALARRKISCTVLNGCEPYKEDNFMLHFLYGASRMLLSLKVANVSGHSATYINVQNIWDLKYQASKVKPLILSRCPTDAPLSSPCQQIKEQIHYAKLPTKEFRLLAIARTWFFAFAKNKNRRKRMNNQIVSKQLDSLEQILLLLSELNINLSKIIIQNSPNSTNQDKENINQSITRLADSIAVLILSKK